MSKTTALGTGPIVFSTDDGAQIEVPLSAIYFESNRVGTYRSPASPRLTKWLEFLASRGRLVPTATPPPPAAIVVTAVAAGYAGNNIAVTVTPKADPTKVDVTATETDKYERLTLETLNAQLGVTGGEAGSRPGLLRVKTNPKTADPVAALDIAATPPAAGATLPTWTAAGAGAAVAFTLEPRRPGTAALFDAGDIDVSVSDVTPPPGGGAVGGTFTLTVTWSRKATNVTAGNVAAKLADLGYVVTVDPPDGGFKLPRPGTVSLAGGSEPTAAVAAKANVLAND